MSRIGADLLGDCSKHVDRRRQEHGRNSQILNYEVNSTVHGLDRLNYGFGLSVMKSVALDLQPMYLWSWPLEGYTINS